VNPRVQFEDEADAEYRRAGRWYEARREHLGLDFFDAVDETIARILDLPRSGAPVPRVPADLPVRTMAVARFPYQVIYLEVNDRIRILAVAHDNAESIEWCRRHAARAIREPSFDPDP
jgi:plasmid stabilization system protein ParE